MGYSEYPSIDQTSQILEIYPHGTFSALIGQKPFPKRSLEGRLQRQLILHNQGLDIPDPMRVFEEITRYRILQGTLTLEGLYSAPRLDALAAAFTAWIAATSPERVSALGHPEEGQVISACSRNLNQKY